MIADSRQQSQSATQGKRSQQVQENRQTGLSLTVIFTGVSQTLQALREAGRLAHKLRASIRILVPHVVPYPLPIEQPRVDPAFRLRHFYTLCERGSIDTLIDVRLCRDARRCIEEALLPHSLVLLSCASKWTLSYERRLAKGLKKAGHEVIFVS